LGIFGKEKYAVVGIGLNVNQEEFPNEIRNAASSLKIIKKQTINMEKITQKIINEFFILYSNYYNKNKLEKILKIWEKHCDTINKNVIVITTTKRIKGKAIGIDKDCSLLLKTKDNKITKIIEGDVSIRY